MVDIDRLGHVKDPCYSFGGRNYLSRSGHLAAPVRHKCYVRRKERYYRLCIACNRRGEESFHQADTFGFVSLVTGPMASYSLAGPVIYLPHCRFGSVDDAGDLNIIKIKDVVQQ